jgi:hypothetical protein
MLDVTALHIVTTTAIFYIIIGTAILRWWTLYVETTLLNPPTFLPYSRVVEWFLGSFLQMIGKLVFFLVSTPTKLRPQERFYLLWMVDAGCIILMNYYNDPPPNPPWYFTVAALPLLECVYYLFSKCNCGEKKEKSKTQ